ncbi:MAG: septal ring lytic transglycosylase RlpA family protein [Desertifilum sp. SIO1I2]|nr:septal ring lytic transglycosylase RlpA family protein [Desertifilum sp. SIO1I2]
MKHKLWSGLTAALLVTALSTAPSTHAESLNQQTRQDANETPQATDGATPELSLARESEAVKVGEYQTCPDTEVSYIGEIPAGIPTEGCEDSASRMASFPEVIAKIQPHELAGRQAATVYVRNIPVLTFLGNTPLDQSNTVKVGEIDGETLASENSSANEKQSNQPDPSEPIWRATTLAAQLNQLNRENLDANTITVSWQAPTNESPEHYTIKVDGKELVAFNAETQLPDSTNNPTEDALQATNRLRRQMGNAPPLREIEGRPQPQRLAIIPKQFNPLAEFKGMASWYGPGFHGNRSASGEIFNQDALTAAHRNLPFGTLVRVTNLDNGTSVVVRINDRGPFIGGRIIDLSAGAARVLGLIHSGVAPVRVEVLGAQSASN